MLTTSPVSVSSIATACWRACKSHPIILISASFGPSSVRANTEQFTRAVARPASLWHQSYKWVLVRTLPVTRPYRELTGMTRFMQRAKREPGYSDLLIKQPRFLQEQVARSILRRGGLATVDDLKSFRQIEQFRVWLGQNQIGGGKCLSADSGIGAFGKQIETQFRGIPEFPLDCHFSVISK